MTTRHQKSKAWRVARGLSQKQLAELTGYTEITIYWFERGETPPRTKAHSAGSNAGDRRIKEWVWRRWQRACGDVDAELVGRKAGEKFAW